MTLRYRLEFRPAAARQLRKLPREAQKTIKDATTEGLCGDPRPRGVVKLSGSGDLWRIRVGRYRVVYRVVDDVLLVTVVKVALRDESTYRWPRRSPVAEVEPGASSAARASVVALVYPLEHVPGGSGHRHQTAPRTRHATLSRVGRRFRRSAGLQVHPGQSR